MKRSGQVQFLLDFFGVAQVWDITWAHAVNSQSRLNQFGGSREIMMIEWDISKSSDGEIIMAHPPDTESDLQFEDVMGKITNSGKGIKLDFKYPQLVSMCLKKLKRLKPQFPLFLHADIVKGPGGKLTVFNANTFISECNKLYPNSILSLGWTTNFISGGGYTETMLKEMANTVQSLRTKQTVTVCIRACYLHSISQVYLDIFGQGSNAFIYLWNAKEDPPLPHGLSDHIEKNIGLDKVTYDLIDKKGDPVLFENDKVNTKQDDLQRLGKGIMPDGSQMVPLIS